MCAFSDKPVSIFYTGDSYAAKWIALSLSCSTSVTTFNIIAMCSRVDYALHRSSLSEEQDYASETVTRMTDDTKPDAQTSSSSTLPVRIPIYNFVGKASFPMPYFTSALRGWALACLALPLLTPRFLALDRTSCALMRTEHNRQHGRS